MEFDFDEEIDEETLAALDQIERDFDRKHEPPAKRQKTESGWRPATANTAFDLDELPEISIVQNGYTFQNLGSKPVPPKSNPVQKKPANTRAHSNRPSSARLLEQITLALANSSSEHSKPAPPQRNAPPRNIPPEHRNILSAAVARSQDPMPPPIAVPLNNEIEHFKKQLQEMRQENEKMQAALKEAEDARIAKVGEVAVLRRGIQKTAEDHATQISKLKGAKDEADTKQASMQRELKEEMERLKTQFIFKQHELESNSRRAPMSVYRRGIREMPSSTQSPFGITRAAGPSTVAAFPLPESTPVRAPPSVIRPQFRSPEKMRKSAVLPGFENSFLESTPKRQPGKEKISISPEIRRPLFSDELQSRKLPPKDVTVPFDDGFGMDVDILAIPKKPFAVEEPTSSPTHQEDEDVKMDDEEDEDDDESMGQAHFNWKAELARVILTHTHPSYPRPTLQLLAEQSMSVAASEDYSPLISRILEAIASTSMEYDYDRAISVITRCLVSMSLALNRSNVISTLIPLLNLLSTLIYFLPSLNSTVLHQCLENDSRATILVLLCNIITQQLHEKHIADTLILADETLSLAESLCWRTPEDSVEKLDLIARDQDVLMVFLNSSQPHEFLIRATRLLALMSIHPTLARSLLSLPLPMSEEENERVLTPKIPQLDRLCSFLIDTRQDEKLAELKDNVVALLSVLSQAHPDALAALTSSVTVIPSLILHLTNISSLIWEEDESLISSPSLISSTVNSLNRTTFLLHYLVFSVHPEIGLKLKLQHAPQRWFNGVTHMFIVTFGRLSYAPLPDWMELEKKYELSAIREVARDLLDLIIDGPEGDSVYAAFHDEEEDEGDMEEQLLGDQHPL